MNANGEATKDGTKAVQQKPGMQFKKVENTEKDWKKMKIEEALKSVLKSNASLIKSCKELLKNNDRRMAHVKELSSELEEKTAELLLERTDLEKETIN